MRTGYTPLFHLECLHGYFADHVCHALTVSPTAATAGVLRRYGLRFRTTGSGGTIYYSDAGLLRGYREVTPLAFTLTSTDPWLDIYTDSEVAANTAPSETIWYFSNQEEHATEIDGQLRRLLHPTGRPLAQPALPVKGRLFTHVFERPVRAATLQVSDVLRNQTVWESQTLAQETGSWTIDLRHRPCGRYRLQVNGEAALEFYLGDVPAAGQWGIVEIHAGGPESATRVPAACQVIDGSGLPIERTFTIALGARKTTWRYYIFGQPGSAYDGHRVFGTSRRANDGDEPGEAEIRFTRLHEPVTRGGRQAAVFESDQPVALCQSPGESGYAFVFRANGQAPGGGRAIRLPYAQPMTTRLEMGAGGPRMCSEIFVYV